MFRCQICQCVTPARAQPHRLIVSLRNKIYPRRKKAHQVLVVQKNGKIKKEKIDDPGGNGIEIVKEISVCPACAKDPKSQKINGFS